jgi:hypothetical protein
VGIVLEADIHTDDTTSAQIGRHGLQGALNCLDRAWRAGMHALNGRQPCAMPAAEVFQEFWPLDDGYLTHAHVPCSVRSLQALSDSMHCRGQMANGGG